MSVVKDDELDSAILNFEESEETMLNSETRSMSPTLFSLALELSKSSHPQNHTDKICANCVDRLMLIANMLIKKQWVRFLIQSRIKTRNVNFKI